MKQNIKISLLDSNTGQITGLPANPRYIKDEKFEQLKQSIIEDPEMLDIRELMVFPFGKRYVIIGGNMRQLAIQFIIDMPADEFQKLVEQRRDNETFLDWYTAIMLLRDKKEIPCKVLDRNTPVEKLRAYTIKDNVGYGEWSHEMLANEWPHEELTHWGMDIPEFVDDEEEEEGEKVISKILHVDCEDVNKLESLFIELQKRGFQCELK